MNSAGFFNTVKKSRMQYGNFVLRGFMAAFIMELSEDIHYLGNIYFTLEEYEKAEKNYKIAIRKLPKNPRSYNNLAWLYFTQKRNLKEAESLASQAVELVAEEESAPYRDTLDQIRQALDKERSGE